jgi:signal transduction histidine kinase
MSSQILSDKYNSDKLYINKNDKLENTNKLQKNIKIEKNIKNIEEIDDYSMSRYLAHEFLNPLSVINNCTELMDLCINGGGNYDNLDLFIKIIKQQIKVCNDLSQFVLVDKNSNKDKINIYEFVIDTIDEINKNNKNVNIIIRNNIDKNLNMILNKNKVYLKVIIDNIFKNILKHTNEIEISINYAYNTSPSKIEIKFLNKYFKSNNKKNYETFVKKMKIINRFTINENKSHFIGLEIIDKFCNNLNIEWNLYHNYDNLYEYTLKIPIK